MASKKSSSPSILASTIKDELAAAFALTQMTSEDRGRLRKVGAVSATSVVAGAGRSPILDYRTFKAQGTKKNFAEHLSRHLGSRVAAALRPWFPGILPDAAGRGHESPARTSKGYKKLDVNYSNSLLGLGLGVSIKTVNARDAKSGRYSKNLTRVDAELRAEAADYHERQPYSVMVAMVFLPFEACQDQTKRVASTFGSAVRMYRNRAGRKGPTGTHMLFERFFVGLYQTDAVGFGDVLFLDVNSAPPRSGPPSDPLSFEDVILAIRDTYDERNNPPFEWADGRRALDEEIDTGEDGATDDDEV